MRHYLHHSIFLAALLGLAACGTKGALTLPPGPIPAPLFGNPTPPPPKPAADNAATPATTPDTNTAKEADR